jgi:hypothetical protein
MGCVERGNVIVGAYGYSVRTVKSHSFSPLKPAIPIKI